MLSLTDTTIQVPFHHKSTDLVEALQAHDDNSHSEEHTFPLL